MSNLKLLYTIQKVNKDDLSGENKDRSLTVELGELLFDTDRQKLFIGLGDGAKPVEVANIVRGPDDGLYFQATGNRFIPLCVRL